jgi:hypothetical protein
MNSKKGILGIKKCMKIVTHIERKRKSANPLWSFNYLYLYVCIAGV